MAVCACGSTDVYICPFACTWVCKWMVLVEMLQCCMVARHVWMVCKWMVTRWHLSNCFNEIDSTAGLRNNTTPAHVR